MQSAWVNPKTRPHIAPGKLTRFVVVIAEMHKHAVHLICNEIARIVCIHKTQTTLLKPIAFDSNVFGRKSTVKRRMSEPHRQFGVNQI